jgi:ferritin-like metal-binding protein YciE
MPKAKELNERDTRLAQWLNEAYAKEAELEAALTSHIALTQKASYKKRLQQHLKETREHKRAVARRIKQLGAQTQTVPGVPAAVGEAIGKTTAAVKGTVGAARALVTEQAETHVRNAGEELREEQVEIALYLRIETFATAVGDKETAQLAKRIGREEQRMAKYLTAELPRLVKDVVKAEVPRDQRATASRARRRTTTRSRSTTPRATTARATTARATSARSASTRTTGARSTSSRSTNGSRSNGASATARPRRSTRARTTA